MKKRAGAPYDVQALRRAEFPWANEQGFAYLNSASTGPLPERTRRAVSAFTELACSPNQELYAAHRDVPARARRLCAQLVGAQPEEIALGFNTTYGINLAASALPLAPGDRVLLLEGEFPANVYPWLNLERRGIHVELVPRNELGLPNEEAALERLARGDIRVFSVSAVSFCSGFRVDLDTISRECQRQGTYLVVDGIQALGVVPIDVAVTRIDILACGGQKWLLSPQGAGFAYVRRELFDQLDPEIVGWMAYKRSQDHQDLLHYALDPLDDARRFELGSLAFSCVDAFNHSLSLLLELDVPCIYEHVLRLQDRLVDWAASRSDVELASDVSPQRRSGIVAFRVADPQRVQEDLRSAGITVAVREGAVRVSVHAFNDDREIDRLISVTETSLGA